MMRSSDCKGTAAMTFLVIIKLDPMATVPDTARARPIYLSSTMRNYTNGEVRERGWARGVAGRECATREREWFELAWPGGRITELFTCYVSDTT